MQSGTVVGMEGQGRAKLAVVIAAVLVGTTGTAQVLGPDSATPLGVGAVRALLGAAGLWLFVPKPSLGTLRRRPRLIGVGAFGVAIYQPAFFVGVDRVGVAIGTVLAIGSGPAFAGMMAAVLGHRPSTRWAIGTMIAVVGGAIMVLAPGGVEGEAALDLFGVLAALAAGFGYALYTTTTGLLADRGANSTEGLAWQFSLGSLVLIPVLFSEPMGWLGTGTGLLLAVHLGLVTIAVAYALIGYALARVDAPTVTTLFQAEPVTASILAVVVLHESLPFASWAGAMAVIVGLIVATGQRNKTTGPVAH